MTKNTIGWLACMCGFVMFLIAGDYQNATTLSAAAIVIAALEPEKKKP